MTVWSNDMHIGRSFGDDHHLEDECPCPQEPCGLIAVAKIEPGCPQHDFTMAMTIRQSHSAADCPVKPRRALVEDVEDMVTEADLVERIEKAKAALEYFGPQGQQIIGILEGKA